MLIYNIYVSIYLKFKCLSKHTFSLIFLFIPLFIFWGFGGGRFGVVYFLNCLFTCLFSISLVSKTKITLGKLEKVSTVLVSTNFYWQSHKNPITGTIIYLFIRDQKDYSWLQSFIKNWKKSYVLYFLCPCSLLMQKLLSSTCYLEIN